MTATVRVESLFHHLVPDVEMLAPVAAGSRLSFATLDASGGQFTESEGLASADPSRLFPVSGPVAVAGVRAGDTLRLRIEAIDMAERGHTWTRPGLGFASPVDYHVRELASEDPVIDWGADDIAVASRPHVGTIGVVPDAEFEPRSLGVHGGNLDSTHLRANATVWLRAQVDGGGVFVGDVHAAMGDAEVCGTGIEVAAVVDLTIDVDPRWSPNLPTVLDDDRYWIIADGDTFDEALARGIRECTRLLALDQGMSDDDAYLAVGLLLEVEVCQVVNPRRSVALSLGQGADRVLGPDNRGITG